MVENLPAVQETRVQSLGWEDPLEKGMATQSSILAWRIPWTEEPCELQSTGLQRGKHNCKLPNTHTHAHPTLLVAVKISTLQSSSVTQWCSTLCNPVDCSMPGLPVHHQLLEQAPGDSEGQGSLVCCHPWDHKEWHGWATDQQPPKYHRLGGLWTIRLSFTQFCRLKFWDQGTRMVVRRVWTLPGS